jgi:hypothetical protein
MSRLRPAIHLCFIILLVGLCSPDFVRAEPFNLELMQGKWFGKIQISPTGAAPTMAVFRSEMKGRRDTEVMLPFVVKKGGEEDDLYRLSLQYENVSNLYLLTLSKGSLIIAETIPMTYSPTKGFSGEHQIFNGTTKDSYRASVKGLNDGWVFSIIVLGEKKKPIVEYLVRISRQEIPLFGN